MAGLAATVLGMRPARVDAARARAHLAHGPVLVTGSSRGVGAATAVRCALLGAHVVLVARSAGALGVVAERVEAVGGRASVVTVDLRDDDAATAAATAVVAEHGTPSVLVSNAGHSIRRDLADYTDRAHDVQRLVGVNLTGAVAFALPVLEAMIGAGRGHLISVGTAAVGLPTGGWSAYVASKAGYEAWMRAVGTELAPSGVATTSIHLPLTTTAMSAPTYARSPLPALTPDDAASWVMRAVTHRPTVIAPWWARAGAILTTAAPALARRAGSAVWARP